MALTATAGIARILQLLPVQAVRTGHHCVQITPVPGHSPPAKLHGAMRRAGPPLYDLLPMWIQRFRARMFKLLRSPGIDSKESVPPAYVAWWAGTITLFLLGSYSPHRKGGERMREFNTYKKEFILT